MRIHSSSQTSAKPISMPMIRCLVGIASVVVFAPGAFADSIEFDIEGQATNETLLDLAETAGIQIAFATDRASQSTSPAISGSHSVEQALDEALQGTGLNYQFANTDFVVVMADNRFEVQPNIVQAANSKNLTQLAQLQAAAQAALAAAETLADESEAEEEKALVLENITVTASRHKTFLQDTAMSISVITGEDIERRHITNMNDYLRTMPGVNYWDQGVGKNAVIIRGITVNPQVEGFESSPVVSIYFGDVPLAGMSLTGGNANIRTIDLDRVEVLRGPQGTLFGSNSLGGTVRNIPNAPNLQDVEGRFKARYSNTTKEGGDNYDVEGVINIPLIEDVLAVRVVAYYDDTSGFYRNIAGTQLTTGGESRLGVLALDDANAFNAADLYLDKENVGTTVTKGGRVSYLWKPVDDLSVTLTHLYQNAEQVGVPFAQLNTGDYTQVHLSLGNHRFAAETNGYKDKINLTNLVVEYDLGWGVLSSSTAWISEVSHHRVDVSDYLGGLPMGQTYDFDASKTVEELRLVSELDGPLQFIAGFYYDDTKTTIGNEMWISGDMSINPMGFHLGDTNRNIMLIGNDRKIEERSFYGELSYDITDQLEVTGGTRFYDYARPYWFSSEGLFGSYTFTKTTEESGTNSKLNLSFSPTDDALFYAQWAEGFRFGNINGPIPRSVCDVNNDGILDGTSVVLRDSFDSDSTENFEVGAKVSLLDNRLQVNAAVYSINWDAIPLAVAGGALPGQERICFSGTTTNAGSARSQGFEIETKFLVNDNLQINLGGAYVDAELTSDFPQGQGLAGDRLPASPELSVNFGMSFDFSIKGYSSNAHAEYAYISEFYNWVGETGEKAGDYGELDAGVGIDIGNANIELYVDNLTNEDSIVSMDLFLSYHAYRLRPRTIGVSFSHRF